MNLEKTCRLKKVFYKYMQSPRTKSSQNKTFLGSRDVFKKMQKKSFLTPLGLVHQYNSPKPYCIPSIIIQGNFHFQNSSLAL